MFTFAFATMYYDELSFFLFFFLSRVNNKQIERNAPLGFMFCSFFSVEVWAKRMGKKWQKKLWPRKKMQPELLCRYNFIILSFQPGGYLHLFSTFFSVAQFLEQSYFHTKCASMLRVLIRTHATQKKKIESIFFMDKALALIASFDFDQTMQCFTSWGQLKTFQALTSLKSQTQTCEICRQLFDRQ